MKKPLILFTVVLFVAGSTFAQTGVWKKTVSRTIDIAEKEDTVRHHLSDASDDSTLLEMMIGAIKAGKLTAYSAFDHSFTSKMSVAELKEMTASKTDTQIIVDPITNKEILKIIRRDFDPYAIHKYRFLEEWTFNPNTGKTDIQITGLSPMLEVYGEDGVYRGSKPMFWAKYNDVRPILSRYEQAHPNHTLSSLIWDDYFLSDVKPTDKK